MTEKLKQETINEQETEKLDQETINELATDVILPIRIALDKAFALSESIPLFDPVKISNMELLVKKMESDLRHREAASIFFMAKGATETQIRIKECEMKHVLNMTRLVLQMAQERQAYAKEAIELHQEQDNSAEFLKKMGF